MKNVTSDPLVNRVIARMKSRSDAGMTTYGQTMEREDIPTLDWLRHAQEEALDLAIYLERCINDLQTQRERLALAEWKSDYPTKSILNGWGG